MDTITGQSRSRRSDISLLRIAATIAVVFLHANSTLTDNRELFQLSDSQVTFFLCSYTLFCWAVPVFLMMTGALMLKREKSVSYKDCGRKYCKRIILALFIFGVPFSMMELFANGEQISPAMVLKAVMNVVEGKSFAHLWYLYVLIGLYLVLPFLKSAVDNLDRKNIKMFLTVLFLLNFCIPLIEKLAGIEIAFMVPFTTFPVFYVVCGYYMDEYVSLDKKKAVFGFVSMMILVVIVAFISDSGNYLGYDSPIIGFTAMFVFAAFKGLSEKKENACQKFMDRLWKADRLCFGVYLIHPVFIHFTYRVLKLSPISFKLYWLAMPVFAAAFLVCAFAGSWILSKIKPLKKYVL